MRNIELFQEALIALFTFKNYTTMPRWMEISMSIQAYLCVVIIIYCIFC